MFIGLGELLEQVKSELQFLSVQKLIMVNGKLLKNLSEKKLHLFQMKVIKKKLLLPFNLNEKNNQKKRL
jgi:hypothetical protein